MTWVAEWPKVEGWYAFYGWTSAFDKKNSDRRLHFVKVIKIGNGITCVTDGYFIYEREGAEGIWMSVEAIVPPEQPQHYYRDQKIRLRKGSPFYYSADDERTQYLGNETQALVTDVDYERRRVEYRPVGGKFFDQHWTDFTHAEPNNPDSPYKRNLF